MIVREGNKRGHDDDGERPDSQRLALNSDINPETRPLLPPVAWLAFNFSGFRSFKTLRLGLTEAKVADKEVPNLVSPGTGKDHWRS